MKNNPLKVLLESYYCMPDVAVWRFAEARLISAYYAKYYRGGKVLDIGCGDGVFGSLIAEGDIDIGMDADFSELKKAASAGVRYRYLALMRAENLAFKKGRFTFIFSNCALEHIKDIEAVLSEARRILVPAGTLVFTVPSAQFKEKLLFARLLRSLGLQSFSRHYVYRRLRRLKVEHILSLEEWREILGKIGFRLAEYQYYMSDDAGRIFSLFHELGLSVLCRLCWPFKKRLVSWLASIIESSCRDNSMTSGIGLCLVATRC